MVETLNSLSAAWWSWLAPLSVQVAVLAALVWLVDLPLRRRGWPQVRYALWAVVFLRLLLPPGLALPTSIPSRILASLRSAEAQAVVAPAPVLAASSAPVVAGAPAPADTAPAAPLAPIAAPRLTLKTLAMLAWLAVSLLLLSLLVRKALSIRRSLAAASAAPDWLRDVAAEVATALHMKRAPRVLLCDFIRSAAVFGPLRPVILLPTSWTTEYTREQLFHILLHESAHIRRGDLAANAGQALLHIAFWFHPFVWLAGGRARELRELCCDVKVSLVLGQGRTPMYRETLIAVARKVIAPAIGLSLGLLGLFESPSGLAARLDHLTRRPFLHRRLRFLVTLSVALAAVLLVLPMAAQPTSAASASEPQPAGDNTLRAVIVQPDGSPAIGIDVSLDRATFATGQSSYAARTDANGAIAVEVSDPKSSYFVVAETPDAMLLGLSSAESPASAKALPFVFVPLSWSVSGTVKDAQGLPLAGASVSVAAIDPRSASCMELLKAGAVSYDVAPLLQGTPDAGAAGDSLALALVQATASIPWNRQAPMAFYSGDKAKLVVLADDAVQDVVKHYLDSLRSSRGIASAILSSKETASTESLEPVCLNLPSDLQSRFTALTGADGTFVLSGLPAYYAVRVKAGAPGRAAGYAEVVAGGGPADITLKPGARVMGRVTSDDPSIALAGNEVQFFNHDTRAGAFASTDAAGAFIVEGVEPGECQIVVIKGSSVDVVGSDFVSFQLAAGETRDIALGVTRGAKVSGRLVDAATGEPAPPGPRRAVSFTVRTGASSSHSYTTTIQSDGAFSLYLKPDAYEVGSFMRKEDGTFVNFKEPGIETVVEPGKDIDLGVLKVPFSGAETPKPGAKITGRLLPDSAGLKVEGVTIFLFNQTLKDGAGTTTDAQGAFAFDGVQPGRVQVTPQANDAHPVVGADDIEVIRVSDASPQEIVINVTRGTRVYGLLVDKATGKPAVAPLAAGISVAWDAASGGTNSMGVNTDKDGRYSMYLRPDTYRVQVSGQKDDTAVTCYDEPRFTVTIPAADSFEMQTIAVPIQDGTGQVVKLK